MSKHGGLKLASLSTQTCKRPKRQPRRPQSGTPEAGAAAATCTKSWPAPTSNRSRCATPRRRSRGTGSVPAASGCQAASTVPTAPCTHPATSALASVTGSNGLPCPAVVQELDSLRKHTEACACSPCDNPQPKYAVRDNHACLAIRQPGVRSVYDRGNKRGAAIRGTPRRARGR